MGTKTAWVKMTLDNNGFLSGLKTVSGEVEKVGQRLKSALSGGAGWKAMKGEIASMGGGLKDAAVGAAKFGGSLLLAGGLAGGIKNAPELTGRVKDIHFRFR